MQTSSVLPARSHALMAWYSIICFLSCLHLAYSAATTIIDDNSVGMIIAVTDKCVDGLLFNYRNGSSVVYGTGQIAGKSTQALLGKGETLSAVEWIPGRDGCCQEKLGTSYVFVTSTGTRHVVQGAEGHCKLGEVSRFKLQRPSDHITGLVFSNKSLSGIEMSSLCYARDLCFMQGHACLMQGRRRCLTSAGSQHESGFVKHTGSQNGVSLCCEVCEKDKYADQAEGKCKSCTFLYGVNADQSECELNSLHLLALVLGTCVWLFFWYGHKCLGCPPLWLLLLERCISREKLARKCCASYYFICECRHPDHSCSTTSFKAVQPEDAELCEPCACGWQFRIYQQPGIKDIARCKFCTNRHNEYCVRLKHEQEEALDAKLHAHVDEQLQGHFDWASEKLQSQQSDILQTREHHNQALEAHITTFESSTSVQEGRHESMEEQFQLHLKDTAQKWKTQRTESKEAQHRHTSLKAAVTKLNGKHELLEEQMQALQNQTYSESEMQIAEIDYLKSSCASQLGLHEILEAQVQAHARNAHEEFQALQLKDKSSRQQQSEELSAAEASKEEMRQVLDAQLRTELAQVHDKFAAQQAENSEVRNCHLALEAAASKQVDLHEGLEEQLQDYLVKIFAKFGAQQSEADEAHRRQKAALEAASSEQRDLHKTLFDLVQAHQRETHEEFEAQLSDNQKARQLQTASLETSESKQLGLHVALEEELQAHVKNTEQKFEFHDEENKKAHDDHGAGLQAAQVERMRHLEQLQEQLQAHAQQVQEEFEAQQLESEQMHQEQREALELQESRLMARHENFESSVGELRVHLGNVHEGFEEQHRHHRDAQEMLQSNMKAEHEEFLSTSATAASNFDTFKDAATAQMRKHDLNLQRIYAELGTAGDQIGKQSLSMQRVYAELGIPLETMPAAWGVMTPPRTASTVSPRTGSRMSGGSSRAHSALGAIA